MITEKIARDMMSDCQLHETYHDRLITHWRNEGIISDIDFKYYRDSTVGLWATDKPEVIPTEIKDLFWELK